MKWFSLSGIKKEINRIRWPKTKDMTSTSIEVIGICVFFGVFFVFSEFLISFFLRMIGIGA